MPTNDFQELVRAIEQLLGSKNIKVKSPIMVQAQGLPDFREVDILLEDEMGQFSIKVAVEATKLGRPLGIAKYDSICKKYTGEGKVAVDKFIIVTVKGFTRDVIRKAERENVELITLAEVTSEKGKDVFSVRPLNICTVKCKPPFDGVSTKDLLGGMIHCQDERYGVRCLGRFLIAEEIRKNQPKMLKELFKRATESTNGIAHFYVSTKFKTQATIVAGEREQQIEGIHYALHMQVRKGMSQTNCFDRVSTKKGTTKIVQSKLPTAYGDIEAMFSFGADGKTPGEKATVKMPPELVLEFFKQAAMRQRTQNPPSSDEGQGK